MLVILVFRSLVQLSTCNCWHRINKNRINNCFPSVTLRQRRWENNFITHTHGFTTCRRPTLKCDKANPLNTTPNPKKGGNHYLACTDTQTLAPTDARPCQQSKWVWAPQNSENELRTAQVNGWFWFLRYWKLQKRRVTLVLYSTHD